MAQFKVGDRVLYRADGDEGVITSVRDSYITVEFDGDGETIVYADEIDMVPFGQFQDSVKAFANAAGVNVSDLEDIATLGDKLGISSFEQSVRRILNDIGDMLVAKNESYNNAALNPINVFSKSDRTEQIRTRIDDKLNRIRNGHEYPGDDTVSDLIGYLVILKIAEESA